MVFLTMTPAIVQALEAVQKSVQCVQHGGEHTSCKEDLSSCESEGAIVRDEKTKEAVTVLQDEQPNVALVKEPSLQSPEVGKPISHGQIIELSEQLKAQSITPNTLDILLRGTKVYIAPPPPKPEPSAQYKALMARLRREEEARSYERMTNPPAHMETFSQRFPMSSAAHAFAPISTTDPFADTEEISYADVDRQMALVFNVLVSIIACAGGIWVVARWWSTPARLALSLSGSLLVGIAEVVVYLGYVRRITESKGKEKGMKEVKEVVKTWMVGGDVENDGVVIEKSEKTKGGTRRRLGKPS